LSAGLDDPAIRVPSHPLYVARKLLVETEPAEFLSAAERLAGEIQQQQAAHAQLIAQTVPFADFRRGDFAQWSVTGYAFGREATANGQVDGSAARPRLSPPGIAHSGAVSRKLQGVLRSPTFTLQHAQVHYRIKADQARIRLIVDGYTMDLFSPLLFADVTLESVSTDGQFRWVTQQQDLSHYLGHRAHLEIIDQGDGFAALEQVCFSDVGPPQDPPSQLAQELLAAGECRSPESLAAACARSLVTALRAWQSGTLSADETELINWLLQWQVIEPAGANDATCEAVESIERQLPEPVYALAMTDGTGEDERIHIRGSHRNLGPAVPRRMLIAIAGEQPPTITQGSGRMMLADQMVSGDNPLVSRVIVNRLWHHLFGRGLVPTVDDFGVMGQPPNHPQLLDWLALDLVRHDWSMKHAVRQLVTSHSYQLDSVGRESSALAIDPDNAFHQRARIRKLPAESIRDAMLAVSGQLDRALDGPSVPVHLTPFMSGRGQPASGPLDGHGRRSIYIKVQRNFLSPMMLAFDMPPPFSTMGRRSNSNVPAQSLILMNDPFVWQQSERWAARLLAAAPTVDARIDRLFVDALGHPPSAAQRTRMREFLGQQADATGQSSQSLAVWIDACHAVFNMKEFIYLY
jgi:hypothetical protein